LRWVVYLLYVMYTCLLLLRDEWLRSTVSCFGSQREGVSLYEALLLTGTDICYCNCVAVCDVVLLPAGPFVAIHSLRYAGLASQQSPGISPSTAPAAPAAVRARATGQFNML
jgi:hypothetical protein